jgi:hypothetical protein
MHYKTEKAWLEAFAKMMAQRAPLATKAAPPRPPVTRSAPLQIEHADMVDKLDYLDVQGELSASQDVAGRRKLHFK